MAEIKAYYDDMTGTISFLVWDPASKKAALIDPILNYEPASATLTTSSVDAILAEAGALGLELVWSLETHVHADHISASSYVRDQTGAKIGIGEHVATIQNVFKGFYNLDDIEADGRQFDALFADGDTFQIGDLTARVLHTPGHTPACITYVIDGAAFVGDTLFMPDYGTARTDFPGGSAQELYKSIQKILSLPGDTRIMVGHDYPPTEAREEAGWEASVTEHKANNVHIKDGTSEAEFVTFRETRDAGLKAPALILPSLQANIRAGALAAPEADGFSYLKVPVNKLSPPNEAPK